MYLTTSRPDIMFAVCACARFQVSPKTSHLLAVKRIFRYLQGKPSLGLWYSKDSPLELVAYTDSDYAGATQDRKSTTKGCQFLGNRLISWQCKKQTVVATSITKAEYVVAASCYGQVLWIQNQLLDYGYNFMNIVIYIDNNSTICMIENPVQHSKTKHIEIRHHFIRDCNAKKLIQMVKIDTEHNVADLLTKGFDAGRFQYLVSNNLSHRIALGMERDCQHGLYKAGMGSSRVLSDFAEKYGSKNRVLAGFGIGGKSGKEKVEMDDPNITMKEYIRLEEEKGRRPGEVFNWEIATYGKIWDNEDVHDLRSVETEFPAIALNNEVSSETPSC
ncbi:hypothetical protein Tco_1548010 [Tanacetum coccineum]